MALKMCGLLLGMGYWCAVVTLMSESLRYINEHGNKNDTSADWNFKEKFSPLGMFGFG